MKLIVFISLFTFSFSISAFDDIIILKDKSENLTLTTKGSLKYNSDNSDNLDNNSKKSIKRIKSVIPTKRLRIYCDWYRDDNTSGFSLYRSGDDQDIANAVFSYEVDCREAAEVANLARTGIVCARHSLGRVTSYSIYRIYDNKDLGYATINDFRKCQDAVRYSRPGYFCSTYINNNKIMWSPYSINTGRDVGRTAYGSLNSCLNNL